MCSITFTDEELANFLHAYEQYDSTVPVGIRSSFQCIHLMLAMINEKMEATINPSGLDISGLGSAATAAKKKVGFSDKISDEKDGATIFTKVGREGIRFLRPPEKIKKNGIVIPYTSLFYHVKRIEYFTFEAYDPRCEIIMDNFIAKKQEKFGIMVKDLSVLNADEFITKKAFPYRERIIYYATLKNPKNETEGLEKIVKRIKSFSASGLIAPKTMLSVCWAIRTMLYFEARYLMRHYHTTAVEFDKNREEIFERKYGIGCFDMLVEKIVPEVEEFYKKFDADAEIDYAADIPPVSAKPSWFHRVSAAKTI